MYFGYDPKASVLSTVKFQLFSFQSFSVLALRRPPLSVLHFGFSAFSFPRFRFQPLNPSTAQRLNFFVSVSAFQRFSISVFQFQPLNPSTSQHLYCGPFCSNSINRGMSLSFACLSDFTSNQEKSPTDTSSAPPTIK